MRQAIWIALMVWFPWGTSLASAQQRVFSLDQAHALALKEPGTKLAQDTGPFSGMTHTAWTRADGAPGSISSLAQTRNGYLWIGSSLGLYRFDGVQFSEYPFSPDQPSLPTQDVQSLAADNEGGLWVGLRITAVVNVRSDGTVRLYGRSSGLASDTLDHIAVRRDGSVWVLAGGNLLTLRGDSWVNFGEEHRLGRGAVFSFFFDRSGTIWVAQDHRVMVLRRGDIEFVRTPGSVFFVSAMTQTRDGRLWMADAWRTVRTTLDPPRDAVVRLQGKANLLADGNHNLWIAEDFFGLTRIREIDSRNHRYSSIEHASSRQLLSSPQIGAIFEDRDGNIWAGTALGLDRYQLTAFEHFRTTPLNFYPSVVAARDGSVWINSHGEPLMRWYEGHVTTYGTFVTYGPFATRRNGQVCFVDARASELQCYGSTKVTSVLLDRRIEYAPALAMVEDADGSILVSFENKGIWRYRGAWEPFEASSLPSLAPLSMLLDSSRRLWIGFEGKDIAVRSHGRFTVLKASTKSWANTLSICEGADTLWVAGSSGLSFFDGQAFKPVHSDDDRIFDGTSGLAFDANGNLWLNSGAGALRISSASVQHILHSADRFAHVQIFNERDGLSGKPTQLKPTPSLVRDATGRLWFATAGDLVRVDPRDLGERRRTLNIVIQSILLDGKSRVSQGKGDDRLRADPAARHSLEVHFAAPDLSDPERTNYRYQLVGDDSTWQDAGPRREAFYTRLRPGHYSFQVSARQAEGPWVELRAPLSIEILPTFYQTNWFDAVAVVVFALVMVAIYFVRTRQIRERAQLVSEERLFERIKIAQDLHDTLLQGVHALILRFHSVAESVADSGQRGRIEAALTFAEKICAEGRDRVRSLRAAALPADTLLDSIVLTGEALNSDKRAHLEVSQTGIARSLRPSLRDEIFCIAREALANACEHSGASKISVTLDYGKAAFRMSCLDNGCGIDTTTVRVGRTGHWGLQGMHERAKRIGAHFENRSTAGGGAEIVLTISAARAYEEIFRTPNEEQSAQGRQGDSRICGMRPN